MAKKMNLLKIAQVAEILGMTRAGVHYAIKEGLIKAEHFGPYSLIREEEARRYKNNRPKKGRPFKEKN